MIHEKADFDVLGKIESERIKRNWTEYTLAKNSGLTQSTISTWYRRGLQPSISSIESICKGLGISLSSFFTTEDSDNKLTDEQKQLLDFFGILTADQRYHLLELLKAFTVK